MTSSELTVALSKIRLLALDVDGVLTDGGVYYDAGGMNRFHVHDGLGIVLAGLAGLEIAWITGRKSLAVERRAKELGVTWVQQGVRNKVEILTRIAERLDISPDEIAYMGDDLNDLPAMLQSGIAIVPANAASPEVRDAAQIVTARAGGHGAVRDAIEIILRARGDWDAVLAAYLTSLSEPSAKNPIQ